MAVQALTIALTTNPTLIAGDGVHGNLRVYVRNRGAATVYLGSSGVTTGGLAVTTSEDAAHVRLNPTESLYGCSTGSIVVGVLRVNETT